MRHDETLCVGLQLIAGQLIAVQLFAGQLIAMRGVRSASAPQLAAVRLIAVRRVAARCGCRRRCPARGPSRGSPLALYCSLLLCCSLLSLVHPVALIADNVSGCGRLCTGGGSAAGALLQSAVADAPRCAYCGIWRPVLRRRRRRCWRSPRRPSPTPSASARSCAGRSRSRNKPQ